MNPGSWPNVVLHQQKWTCVHFPAEKVHFSSVGLKYREKGFGVFEKMCKYLPDLGVCDVNYTTSNFKLASSFLTRLLHSTVANWLQDQNWLRQNEPHRGIFTTDWCQAPISKKCLWLSYVFFVKSMTRFIQNYNSSHISSAKSQ